MIVLPETPEDINAIEEITRVAFAGRPYADGTEHAMINRLREAQVLALSLVAYNEGRVVGHIAFSVVTIDCVDRGWYGPGTGWVRFPSIRIFKDRGLVQR